MAFLFNGSTKNRFSGGSISNIQPTNISYVFWINFLSLANSDSFVVRTAGDPNASWSHALSFDSLNKQLSFYMYTGTVYTANSGTNTITKSNYWYHIAATAASNGYLYMYINGVQTGTPVLMSGNLWNGGNDFWLFTQSGLGFPNANNVLISNFSIFYSALSPSTIQQLYQSTQKNTAYTINTGSLILHLPMAELPDRVSTSNYWYDLTLGGYSQTITGGVTGSADILSVT